MSRDAGKGERHGPNFLRLLYVKMSKDAIPDGGGFADGVKFLSNPETIKAGWLAAEKWVAEAIQLVRQASDPNPFRTASDEEIAKEVLDKMEAKKRVTR